MLDISYFLVQLSIYELYYSNGIIIFKVGKVVGK